MNFNFKDIKESVRIKKETIQLTILTAFGKDGEHFMAISPALLVSGYGNNEDEAKQSFTHNLELFCKDLMALAPEKRDLELKKLGFNKEPFKTKNFSKLYIDENGALQGMEPGSIKTTMLEALV